MGRMRAEGMAEGVRYGSVSLYNALHYHLTVNHYPPVPASMVPVARAAVEAHNEGEPERRLKLPPGVTYREYSTAPASLVIETYHLDAFLDSED